MKRRRASNHASGRPNTIDAAVAHTLHTTESLQRLANRGPAQDRHDLTPWRPAEQPISGQGEEGDGQHGQRQCGHGNERSMRRAALAAIGAGPREPGWSLLDERSDAFGEHPTNRQQRRSNDSARPAAPDRGPQHCGNHRFGRRLGEQRAGGEHAGQRSKPSIASAASTISSTRPTRSASSAVIRSPVNSIRFVTAGPSRCVARSRDAGG